jgi:hypothetical protein
LTTDVLASALALAGKHRGRFPLDARSLSARMVAGHRIAVDKAVLALAANHKRNYGND